MDNKIYTPTVLEDAPFPQETIESDVISVVSGDIQRPATIKEQSFPVKRISVETIGSSLNTKSRKILQEYSFTQSGAIVVGTYEAGISGDVKISPNGIVARDSAGLTTFALDGTTGDATFRGRVLAGSIISEGEIQGGEININNNFTVDGEGNVTIGISSDIATGISPSLKIYNDEGTLVGELQGDTTIAKYLRLNNSALSNIVIMDNAFDTTNYNNADIYIVKINADDGILLGKSKPLTLAGVGSGDLVDAPSSNQATLFVNQSGGKNRLMVRFPSGASQQIAIEP